MTASSNVAANVRRIRKARGWSQTEMAERATAAGVGMTLKVVSALELGARRITVDEMAALATALGVGAAALLAPPPDVIAEAWASAWLTGAVRGAD